MIEYAMLVMLGFFAGGLVALLIAPTLWNRAVRLTRKRLEATMPMSLADIEADKDFLRASYAVAIRRLETALEKAREKSAGQLVEISKLQMEIGTTREQMAMLEKSLDERSNAANVFEKTIRKRFPELEAQLEAAREALEERGGEMADAGNKLRRREEALALAQQSLNLQQTEIRQLRDALEKSSSEHAARFKKRPAHWTLDEFRSEYDRLNLELSKMREQLAIANERELSQGAVLKAEMQQLAERIMSSATAQAKLPPQAAGRGETTRNAAATRDPGPRQQRGVEKPLAAPKPWPQQPLVRGTGAERQKLASSADAQPPQKVVSAGGEDKVVSNAPAASAGERRTFTSGVFSRASVNAPAVETAAEDTKAEARDSLKSLLDRTRRALTDKEAEEPSLAAFMATPVTASASLASAETADAADGKPAETPGEGSSEVPAADRAQG